MTKLQYNATAPSPADGTSVEPQSDSRGNQKVTLVGGGTASAMAQVDGSSDALGTASLGLLVANENRVFNGTAWQREVVSYLTARLLSAGASTNATSVKASAGNVHKVVGVNTNAAARYLKFYNKASVPTVGTDVPIFTFYLPPTAVNGGQFEFNFGSQPHYFSTGIAYAMTTGAADADTGALTAGDVVALNIAYS